ncbi:unnamed protein product [Agarophyton chilense]
MERSPTGDDVVEEIARHVEGNDIGIPVDGPLPRRKWTRSVAIVLATQKGFEVCDDRGEAVGFVGVIPIESDTLIDGVLLVDEE